MLLTAVQNIDPLHRHVWRFLITVNLARLLVRVESYALEGKPTTRHKWRPQKRWHRLSSMSREWGTEFTLPTCPPVPDDARRSCRSAIALATQFDF